MIVQCTTSSKNNITFYPELSVYYLYDSLLYKITSHGSQCVKKTTLSREVSYSFRFVNLNVKAHFMIKFQMTSFSVIFLLTLWTYLMSCHVSCQSLELVAQLKQNLYYFDARPPQLRPFVYNTISASAKKILTNRLSSFSQLCCSTNKKNLYS